MRRIAEYREPDVRVGYRNHGHNAAVLLSRTYIFAAFGGRWPGVYRRSCGCCANCQKFTGGLFKMRGLIHLALGPTANVLCHKLHQDTHVHFIEVYTHLYLLQ